MLSYFPLDVLDEIWDLIESVSEGFVTYSSIAHNLSVSSAHRPDMTLIPLKRMQIRKAFILPSVVLDFHSVILVLQN